MLRSPGISGLLALTLAVSLVGAEEPEPAGSHAGRTIRKIEIRRSNVFTDVSRRPTFLYRGANRFHIVTREGVIRRDLLIEEGQTLDLELLEQSERRLRGMSFLGSAEIRTEAIGADSVDVIVSTQDQWSLVPSFSLESGGGLTRVGGSLDEYNLLGRGKRLSGGGVYESDIDGTTWSFGYGDPQLLGSRWNANARYETGPLVESISASVVRPFYSPDASYASGLAVTSSDDVVRLFQQSEEVSRLREETRGIITFVSRAFGERFRKKSAQLMYRVYERKFSEIEGQTNSPLPKDEDVNALSLTGSKEWMSFAETGHIDHFLRTEDVVLGSTASLTVGRAGFPVPKGIERWEALAYFRQAFGWSDRRFLFASMTVDYVENRDTVGTLFLRFFDRWSERNTLGANLELYLAKDLEASSQFVLGGDSGLRGYPARSFTGDKRLLFNLENRLFTSVDLLTIHLGGVVFFDGGNAWPRGTEVDLGDLNYSAGLGFRFCFTKNPGSPTARVDVGWPLNRDGEAVWTIGMGQHFGKL